MNTLISLLPLFFVIGLYWMGFRLFKKAHGTQGAGPSGQTPYGVHGVLAFYIFTSYYLAPLVALGRVNSTFIEAELQSPAVLELNGWNDYKIMSFALVLAIVVWQIAVAKQLRWKLVPQSLYNARILCFGSPFVVIVSDIALAKLTLGLGPNGESIVTYLASIIISSLWGFYFLFSKRCKNTYLVTQAQSVGPQSEAVWGEVKAGPKSPE
jgi:hypothetical protein